ncbi:MAG: hypothetical protein ACOXZH_05415 [Bacteroidales bacterium]
MKRLNIIVCVLIGIFLLSCEEKEYYQGEYIIVNDCDELIDIYGIGKNISAPSVAIHDRIPAKSKLSYRRIKITEDAMVKDLFETIEIYKNGQKTMKNPMNQELWDKTFLNNQLTYTLVVDSSFFKN